jgi:hypothetical protein
MDMSKGPATQNAGFQTNPMKNPEEGGVLFRMIPGLKWNPAIKQEKQQGGTKLWQISYKSQP